MGKFVPKQQTKNNNLFADHQNNKETSSLTAAITICLPFTNMKGDIFGIKVFYHCSAGLIHQFLG